VRRIFAPLRRAGTHATGWAPDQQRITPQAHSASKTRVNALLALRSIRGTQAADKKKARIGGPSN
jgi:hypothetical protein